MTVEEWRTLEAEYASKAAQLPITPCPDWCRLPPNHPNHQWQWFPNDNPEREHVLRTDVESSIEGDPPITVELSWAEGREDAVPMVRVIGDFTAAVEGSKIATEILRLADIAEQLR